MKNAVDAELAKWGGTGCAVVTGPGGKKMIPPRRIKVFNKVTVELYSESSEEVKQLVSDYRDDYNKKVAGDLETSSGDQMVVDGNSDEALRMTEEDAEQARLVKLRQRARYCHKFVTSLFCSRSPHPRRRKINGIPETLRTVMNSIYRETGFFGIVAVCDPNPNSRGELASFL